MKKHLAALTFILSAFAMTSAQAQEYSSRGSNNSGPYIRVFTGANATNSLKSREGSVKFKKPGFTGAGALGYKFENGIRVEGEAAYRTHNMKSFHSSYGSAHGRGHLNTMSYSGNVLYDFDNDSRFTPYVGAGVGYTRASKGNRDIEIKNRKGTTSYQGIAGVNYAICDKTQLGLEYRYFKADKLKDHSVGLSLTRFF